MITSVLVPFFVVAAVIGSVIIIKYLIKRRINKKKNRITRGKMVEIATTKE